MSRIYPAIVMVVLYITSMRNTDRQTGQAGRHTNADRETSLPYIDPQDMMVNTELGRVHL
jgi:hypothetical protein